MLSYIWVAQVNMLESVHNMEFRFLALKDTNEESFAKIGNGKNGI